MIEDFLKKLSLDIRLYLRLSWIFLTSAAIVIFFYKSLHPLKRFRVNEILECGEAWMASSALYKGVCSDERKAKMAVEIEGT